MTGLIYRMIIVIRQQRLLLSTADDDRHSAAITLTVCCRSPGFVIDAVNGGCGRERIIPSSMPNGIQPKKATEAVETLCRPLTHNTNRISADVRALALNEVQVRARMESKNKCK